MLRTPLFPAMCVFLVGLTVAPQRPQFRSVVDVMRLDVGVFDRDGRPVHGLRPMDFSIYEDGQEQEIAAFQEIRVPDRGSVNGWLRDVPSDVQSNQAALDGRVLVIVMDDAVAPIQPGMTATAKAIGAAIVDRLGPDDQAAVVFTLDGRNAQGLTADTPLLRSAVDSFNPSVGFVKPPPGQAYTDQRYAVSNWHYYQSSIETLTRTADLLSALPGRRKALLYIGVGVPIDGVRHVEMRHDLADRLKRLLDRAARSNVAIYGFDPSGLGGLEALLGQSGYGRRQGLGFDAAHDQATAYRGFLETVSANTGGASAADRGTYASTIERVFVDTGSYYLIGYRVDRHRSDGFRSVRVQVDRDDVVVRARTGFNVDDVFDAATDEPRDAESTLAQAMAGLVPEAELPMAVTVIPFAKRRGRSGIFAIAAHLRQTAPERRRVERVELRVTAFDPDGRERASKRQRATLALLPTEDAAEYEVLTYLELPPGRYNLRLAGHSPYLDETGSVYYDVEMPRFSELDLAMSGIALTASPGVLAAPKDALRDVLPILPTTQRVIDSAEYVTAFAQIYQKHRRDPRPVTVDMRVLAEDRSVVMQKQTAYSASDFGDDKSVDYRVALPLENWQAGRFVLILEVSDNATSIRRAVPFRVAQSGG